MPASPSAQPRTNHPRSAVSPVITDLPASIRKPPATVLPTAIVAVPSANACRQLVASREPAPTTVIRGAAGRFTTVMSTAPRSLLFLRAVTEDTEHPPLLI